MKELPMENNHGPAAAIVSLSHAFIAWIMLKDAQTLAAITASIIAIASGIMAVRYYYYATKKLKDK